MGRRRPTAPVGPVGLVGLAALLLAAAAAAGEPCVRAPTPGNPAPDSGPCRTGSPRADSDESSPVGGSQPTPVRAGPVFTPGGGWSRAEVGLLIGSQRVNEDLGFSTNIFQTVSAAAQDVGFGEHYGARGSVFFNRYLGVEGAFTRTRTSFEFSISDEEAGVNILAESLVRSSTEFAGALVGQFPLSAMTPYAALGYGSGNASVGDGDDFRSGAFVLGGGVKVPFPQLPFLLTLDFRFFRYREANAALQLAEGGRPPSATVLTVGVMFRLGPSSS